MTEPVSVALIGGSGLYDLAGLTGAEERRVDTPFGPAPVSIRIGRLEGRRVAFLARHGERHGVLPSDIDYRANVWALKSLGVERILSASAVGSMREAIHPRDVVVPDQFLDLTRCRRATFFGEGVAAHVSMADPVCPEASRVLATCAAESGARVHAGGTYLCIEGPAFSTRAESRLYRSWGVEVIGMTNATEAKLAREAEICYASLALVTDFDCWHAEEADVSVEALLGNLRANAALATETLRRAVAALPPTRERCGCGASLTTALITAKSEIPEPTRKRLAPILSRVLGA